MRVRGAVWFTLGVVLGLVGAVGGALATPFEPPAARRLAGTTQAAAARTPPASPRPSPEPPACRPAPLPVRAAQVLVVGLPHVLDADDPLADEVLDVGVGGVLLTKTNVESAEQVRRLVGRLRAGSDDGLLVATDEEPGRVSSFGALLGRTSSARTLARRGTPEDVRAFARDLGAALAAFDVDLDLAPVADLDDGPASGIVGDRSFSADPATASRYALAFSAGLHDAGVRPTVKHFPGHGRSRTDSHRTAGQVDATLAELRATDLVPFVDHIRAGAPVVMLNHVQYDAIDADVPASLAAGAYALLRDLGFSGVAMTDSLGMGAVNLRWSFPEAAVLAVDAGADAVLATDGNHARAMRDALVAAVDEGALNEDRLNEAAARVLALKGEDPRRLTCLDVRLPRFRPPVSAR